VQWGQNMSEGTVNFHAVASTQAVVFTPTGGSAVTLLNMIHFAKNLQTTRFSLAVSNRRDTQGFVAASGRKIGEHGCPIQELGQSYCQSFLCFFIHQQAQLPLRSP